MQLWCTLVKSFHLMLLCFSIPLHQWKYCTVHFFNFTSHVFSLPCIFCILWKRSVLVTPPLSLFCSRLALLYWHKINTARTLMKCYLLFTLLWSQTEQLWRLWTHFFCSSPPACCAEPTFWSEVTLRFTDSSVWLFQCESLFVCEGLRLAVRLICKNLLAWRHKVIQWLNNYWWLGESVADSHTEKSTNPEWLSNH